MKFTEFNSAHTHTLHISSLTQGLESNENPHSQKNVALENCKNVWEENGLLKTRPALNTSAQRLIKSSEYSDGLYYSYRGEGLDVEIDGEIKKMVSEIIDYDISAQYCITHFLNPDGTVYKSAEMGFYRVTDDTFYIPEKIRFFKGKPQSGAGIFAFVGLVNCENYTQKDSRIYELNADCTSWEYALSTYIPTVLINGRGNRYAFALGADQAFTGTPTKAEGLNLLSSHFYAYFSTDGYSSTFRLPYSNLSSGTVLGRLYYNVNSYTEWIIGENKTSAEATLYGATVTMNVNREKGIIYFTVPAGAFEVPLISYRNENNLRITAPKDCGYGLEDLTFSDAVLTTDKTILVASGNTVFEANSNNPLYFPVDSITKVGQNDASVTALASLEKKVFAFKENEIYRIDTDLGKKLSDISLLADSNATFYTCDTLDSECITRESGCKKNTAFISSNSKLYWLAPDCQVHSLDTSQKAVVEIGQPDVKTLLNLTAYSSVSGVAWEKKCLFFCENRGILMDSKDKSNTKWFYWEFPENIRILGGFNIYGKPQLICYNPQAGLCFTADLQADSDQILTKENYSISLRDCPVSALARTKKLSFGCDNAFKKLDYVTVNFSGEANVIINDRLEAKLKSNGNSAPFKITPAIFPLSLMDITFASDSSFSVGSIDVGYTLMSL